VGPSASQDAVIKVKSKVKVKLSLCLTKHNAMKTYWGSGGIALHVLNHGIGWSLVVSFTLRPLYSRGNRPRYRLDRRLGGLQNRYERGGDEIRSLLLSRIQSLWSSP
jgi:hypothetical protein